MNGHILRGTNIAVDYWKIQGRREILIHFLTHLHGDHIVGLTSSWQQPIYCSEFTAELLKLKYSLPGSLLRVCPLNQSIIVTGPASTSFTVTAYDANHCPGAVMFYFQGGFGNIFYTGDFRSSFQIIESCRHLISKIGTLYLDNTFCSPRCVFPSRDECLMSMINIIKQHPGHDVVIGVRKLGKESLLAKLGVVLDETICVSPTCYQMSQLLFTTNVFTTVALSDSKSRIQTVPLHLISRKFLNNLNVTKPTIAIIPSAIYTGLDCQPFCRDPNIFVVPYSDHSNFLELFEFVSTLRPANVLPIVQRFRGPFGVNISDRENMSCFQPVLSKARPERQICMYNSCENRMLHLNQASEEKAEEASPQSRILSGTFDTVECDHNLTFKSPLRRSVSNIKQCFPPWKKKRPKKSVSHHRRRAARGVIYVDPVVSDNIPAGCSDVIASGCSDVIASGCSDVIASASDSDCTGRKCCPDKNKLQGDKPSKASQADVFYSCCNVESTNLPEFDYSNGSCCNVEFINSNEVLDSEKNCCLVESVSSPEVPYLKRNGQAIPRSSCNISYDDKSNGNSYIILSSISPKKFLTTRNIGELNVCDEADLVCQNNASQSSDVTQCHMCPGRFGVADWAALVNVTTLEQLASVDNDLIDNNLSSEQCDDIANGLCDNDEVKVIRKTSIADVSELESSSPTDQLPLVGQVNPRAVRTIFKPQELCSSFGMLRTNKVFGIPRHNWTNISDDLTVFLNNFISKTC